MSGKRVIPRGNKRKKHKADIILSILAVFLLAFIVSMIVIFCKYQSVPDTLIQCVLGTGGIEAIVLGAIKIAKVINERGATLPTESEEDYESCP